MNINSTEIIQIDCTDQLDRWTIRWEIPSPWGISLTWHQNETSEIPAAFPSCLQPVDS